MKRAWAIAIVMALATVGVVSSFASEGDDIPLPQRMRKSQKAGRKGLPNGNPLLRGGGDVTRCSACHLVEGWEKVRFNHDPTGFPLRGAHVTVACGSCHPRGFDVPVADTCAGCHRDRHGGEFGLMCEGCHDDKSWQALFQADAHRRTGFPLIGKHALIPCQQCHGNMRDRTFVSAPLGCVSCHQADYNRTKVMSIDHVAAGFSLECQTCHNTWRFWPARLPQHDACFRLTSGPHNGIRCLGCHTSLPPPTFTGACAVDTLNCTGCHAHECARSNAEHNNPANPALALYQCVNDRCYECHVNDLR